MPQQSEPAGGSTPPPGSGRSARSTRADVAAAAGVSVQTVHDLFSESRRQGRRPGEPTLVRILDALTSTHHLPRLRRGHQLAGKTVFYELPRTWAFDGEASVAGLDHTVIGNNIFTALLVALSRSAGLAGARLEVVVNAADLAWPTGLPTSRAIAEGRRRWAGAVAGHQYEQLLARTRGPVGGFVLVDPDETDDRETWLRAHGVPHVTLGRPTRDLSDCTYVDIDDELGFRRVIAELLGRGVPADRVGHLRILDDQTGPPGRRRRAVLEALGRSEEQLLAAPPRATRGGGIDPITFQIDQHDLVDEEQLNDRLGTWIHENEWVAVVADCDFYAALAYRAAEDRGLRISSHPGPARLVLAACDNAPIRNMAVHPWMTLAQPVMAWSAAAFDVLAQQARLSPAGRQEYAAHRLIEPQVVLEPVRPG